MPQEHAGGTMECIVTCIVYWNFWSDIGIQGTPPVQETFYIHGIRKIISNICNMWSWFYIWFLFAQPTPTKRYTDLGISPFCAQVFAFFNTLCENFHNCHFYHLDIREKLCSKHFTQDPKEIKVQLMFFIVTPVTFSIRVKYEI